MIRVVALSFLLLCLTGSAHAQTAPPPPASSAAAPTARSTAKPPAKPSKTKAAVKPAVTAETGPCGIGVIPVIGDQFVVQRVGVTVFGNEHAETSVPGWGLDDLVVARVRAAAGPGVAVRRIAYSKGVFEDYSRASSNPFRSPAAKLGDLVRQVAGSANCERYVVVTRTINRFGSSNQTVEGIGIVGTGGTVLFKASAALFALTYIQIFDGRDFSVTKQDSASTSDQSVVVRGLMDRIVGPHREFDDTVFPRPPSEAVKSPVLRDGVRALLTESLDKTLPTLLGR